MPVYVYEYVGVDGEFTGERFEVIQSLSEKALKVCPDTGRPVKRVIGGASFSVSKDISPEKAAENGFTTYRRSGKGEYEKVAGQGADAIVDKSSPPVKKAKRYDLDRS